MSERAALQNANFAQLAARHLLDQGQKPARVFAGTGFGPELLDQPKPVAPLSQTMAFFAHGARLSGDRLFGFRLGCHGSLKSAGLLGYIARSSPTSGCFLRNITRYAALLSDSWAFDCSHLAAYGKLSWSCPAISARPARQYTEFLSALILSELREVSGKDIVPMGVSFAHPRDRGIVEMERFFGCVLRFSEADCEVVLAPGDLDLPLASGDPQLLGILRAYGDHLLLGAQSGGLREQVEEAISARLSDGSATLGNIAADLGFSSRTLSRRLAQNGTSYFAILEEMRQALASRYLCQSGLPLSEIAFLLGYASQSSFIEAFRRWTGQTPGEFRADNRVDVNQNVGKAN